MVLVFTFITMCLDSWSGVSQSLSSRAVSSAHSFLAHESTHIFIRKIVHSGVDGIDGSLKCLRFGVQQ